MAGRQARAADVPVAEASDARLMTALIIIAIWFAVSFVVVAALWALDAMRNRRDWGRHAAAKLANMPDGRPSVNSANLRSIPNRRSRGVFTGVTFLLRKVAAFLRISEYLGQGKHLFDESKKLRLLIMIEKSKFWPPRGWSSIHPNSVHP
jgi:hypothetical protein